MTTFAKLLIVPSMELEGIVAFVKVVETGSFTNAARSLRMPKSTVSAQVSALESRLGVTLLRRTTRHLYVTEAGQLYFKHCMEALGQLHAGEVKINAAESLMKGVLRIASPSDFNHSILPPMIDAYLKEFPEMKVELLNYRDENDLWSKGLDLAVHIGEIKNVSLGVRKIPIAGAFCWASPDYIRKNGHPAHPNEIRLDSLIRYGFWGEEPLVLTSGPEAVTLSQKGRLTVDDGETAKVFALRHYGVALLPLFLCLEEERREQLVRVCSNWQWRPNMDISFLIPDQKYTPTKVEAFLKLACQRC